MNSYMKLQSFLMYNCFEHIEFEMSVGHLEGDTQQTLGILGLEVWESLVIGI